MCARGRPIYLALCFLFSGPLFSEMEAINCPPIKARPFKISSSTSIRVEHKNVTFPNVLQRKPVLILQPDVLFKLDLIQIARFRVLTDLSNTELLLAQKGSNCQ